MILYLFGGNDSVDLIANSFCEEKLDSESLLLTAEFFLDSYAIFRR